MVLTLTSDISATDVIIDITGTVPEWVLSGYTFRLDDEVLEFYRYEPPQSPDPNVWRVARGSDPVMHAAGTVIRAISDALASSDDETPPTPFAAGAELSPAVLLGPYRVDFDTDVDGTAFGDSTTPILEVAALPDGCILFNVWAEAITPFVIADAIVILNVFVQPTGHPEDQLKIADQLAIDAVISADPSAFMAAAANPYWLIRVLSGTSLAAQLQFVNNDAENDVTAGAMDVYALVYQT